MSLIKGIFRQLKQLRMAHEDAKLNRRQVGSDRHHNRYYQYFDEEGGETKRVCEYANRTISEDDIDPYWSAWLKKMQREPPTEDQLRDLYEAESRFKQAAFDYEKKDAEMMAIYRAHQEKQAKTERPDTSQAHGQGKDFEPGKWNPNPKK
jgi:NADH:ubiquinone oxidoreductase subunit